MLQATVQEVAELLADQYGLQVATEFINTLLEEAIRVAPAMEVNPVSGDIEVDDYLVINKLGRDGTTKQVRKRVKADNVKELLRKIKYSVPITKFLAMDSNVREYLLYCALHV